MNHEKASQKFLSVCSEVLVSSLVKLSKDEPGKYKEIINAVQNGAQLKFETKFNIFGAGSTRLTLESYGTEFDLLALESKPDEKVPEAAQPNGPLSHADNAT